MNILEKPNYTQVSNYFIDTMMRKLNKNPTCIAVALVIYRKTIGYHKDVDAISISQFHEYTGYSTRTIQDCLNILVDIGLITVIKCNGYMNRYTLNFGDMVVTTNVNEQPRQSLPTPLAITTMQPWQLLPTQKKEKKSIKENNMPSIDGDDFKRIESSFCECYIAEIGKPCHINYAAFRRNIKDYIKQYGVDEIISRIKQYFTLDAKYYGRDILTFLKHWNKIPSMSQSTFGDNPTFEQYLNNLKRQYPDYRWSEDSMKNVRREWEEKHGAKQCKKN